MSYSRSLLNISVTTSILVLVLHISGCGCESSTSKKGNPNKGLSGISLTYKSLASNGHSETDSNKKEGSISGKLLYRMDVDRPWVYGKYYLKSPQEGELADAIVCLSSRELLKLKQPNNRSKIWKMNQRNHQFIPEVLAIQVGDQVKFKNSDKVTHNVNAQSSFESFNLMTPIADSETYKFNKAGNEKSAVSIRCNLHSQMHAWIYVFSHPFHQVTDENGHFEFHNVPVGEYELIVIHTTGGLQSRECIAVRENKKLIIEKTISPDDLLIPPSRE